MRLSLPYPPSVNRLYRAVQGRVIKSSEGRRYAQQVAWEAMKHRTKPLEGELVVHVTAFRPQRRGDLDNVLKAALDALNGVAWHDDSQVVELHALRLDDKTNPRLEVSVQPWKPKGDV